MFLVFCKSYNLKAINGTYYGIETSDGFFGKEHDKEKYALVDSSALSKSYLEPIVQDLISKYENEHGRGKMSVKKEKEKSGSFSYEKRCDEDEDNKPAALKSSKYSSLPKTSRHSPQPKTSRYSPPPKTSRYSPPPKTSRYSPPPKTSRYSPPPKTSRYSPPPKTSRYSPPPKTSRYSPSSKTSRYSPPPKTSRYSPSPKSSRYSPPPKSVRMKARNSESEWKKVSPVREGFRETMCSDRSLYSEEEMWAKIEPEPSYYRREPAYLDIDSRLDQTNNYKRAWTPPNTGNCSDLRVVLEHKKNLGMTSTTARANTNVLAAVSASSEINNVSDSLLHLIDDMSPEVFLSLALFKLDNMLVQEETELKLLDRVANKATALALDVKKKFLPPDLKAKYKEALAQNGISPQSNSMKGVSSQSNLEFTQNLNNLIGHYKDRKTTAYEDVHSQDSYSNRLLQSEQFIDNRSSAHHQLTTSPQCRNSQERASSFESEWNQRSSTSLPFQSFSSTPTTIPGLTLTEEPPAQPSTSTVLSQFAQTAKNIFGNINVPTTPSNPYQNEDYNRLNYRY
ncbi:unnamed protein product [Larinioides sclopetarius]|uniref:Uncharacterized protein n=1 Tax=Larinioides sclopetarius TaxID=280406 RepID=A0AAV2ACJ0_9ARAC